MVGYECNGHRHITDLCRELKNVHVYSYLQIFISVFAVVGCVLFRKNIKYIWPQIIPALLAISSSSVYLAIFYKGQFISQVTRFVMFHWIEHSDAWLNETKAFNAVIAMSLTTILITLIVMCLTAVFFFWFEKIFHQKKSFCTTTFLYTVTCEFTIVLSILKWPCFLSFGADVCHSNLYHIYRLEVRLWCVSGRRGWRKCWKVWQHCLLGARALQLRAGCWPMFKMIIE